LDREDSPWYPTLRQFRQPKPGDWDSVIAKLCEELCRVAAERSSVSAPAMEIAG
jgi:hypothetical protein